MSVVKISDSVDNLGIEGISVPNLIIDSNLSLTKGKRYGMCGKNGCGKTTLLKGFSSLIQNEIEKFGPLVDYANNEYDLIGFKPIEIYQELNRSLNEIDGL